MSYSVTKRGRLIGVCGYGMSASSRPSVQMSANVGDRLMHCATYH